VAAIVEGINTALFPNRLSARELADESVDNFVGHTLDEVLSDLVGEVAYELHFVSGDRADSVSQEQARSIVRKFAGQLPGIRSLLESDLRAAFENDSTARSVDEVLVCRPGIMAILHYRLAHELHELGVPLVARIIAEIAHSLTGIDIHPGARIQGGLFIDHGTGVVIGENALIGERVRLSHGVTLGAKLVAADRNGTSHAHVRYPIVEDDVVINAGATILGRLTIGRGSVIGGNVWLTSSVPPGSNICQARIRSEEANASAVA
jgi:serine O-acetyltransferase